MSPTKSTFILAIGLSVFLAAALSFGLPTWTTRTVCGSVSSAKLVTEDGTTEVGNLYIWNTQQRLHTRIEPNVGWKMVEVSYQPARWLSHLPKNGNGSLSYAQFEYQRIYKNPIMSTTFQTPQNWDLGDDLHMAARVVLVRFDDNGNEVERLVAWGDGKTYSTEAQYFKHIIQPCNEG